ncbi:MAG: FHA domain-containing protein, partial [Chloroflexota bacterium]|nr:FHA domain-containing protein [Chloroflexota bacterium]
MRAEEMPISGVSIQFLSGPLTDKVIAISKAVTTLGRDAENDIVVLDPRVSRRHACIRLQGASWTIENLAPNNFIAINQQRMQQGALQNSNVVSLGESTSFVFLLQQTVFQPHPSYPQPATPTPPPMVRPGAHPSGPQAAPTPPPMVRPGGPGAWTPANIPLGISPSGTAIASLEDVGMPTLTVSSNIHSNEQKHILNKPVMTIGRESSSEIAITEPVISGMHAQIVREGNDLVLIHPHPARGKTLNGLWYQGQRLRGDQQFRKRLTQGDIFRIGDQHGTLVTLTYNDGTGAQPQEILPEMQPIPLTGNTLTIGRTPDNTIVLNHPQVSAHHAVIEKVEGGYRITDNNSTNHVYVNGQRITNQPIRTGDEIRIGPYRLIHNGTELKQYDESNHIRIDAMNLKKVGNNNVILLNDISLVIPPRKFVALVGGSGAGKSTLMDALNGLRPAQEGTVLYNGVDYYRKIAAFSTQLGYVPQDDIVHRELTVERALYYSARLRLPGDFTREQIKWRIDEVLADVEMTDRRHLLVNKLSGGQRKRVSIALELLANPGIFFLDEPTSGLDPGLDRKMMSLLRRLADRGRTIILVTHATNNINACDYVCFLAQGGRLAYFGPPNEAKRYFDKTDFAEIYSTLEPSKEQPDIPKQAEARFLASPDYQQ